MADLAFAAGFAGDEQGVAIASASQHVMQQNPGGRRGNTRAAEPMEMYEFVDPTELPSVDDLEVAACAAAAAMEVLAPQDTSDDDSSDDDSSEEDTDSDDEDSSGDEGSDSDSDVHMGDADGGHASSSAAKGGASPTKVISVSIAPNPEAPDAVKLDIAPKLTSQGTDSKSKSTHRDGTAMRDAMAILPSSGEMESSSSSESEDENHADGEEILDYDQMREMITKAYQVVDEEDEDDAEGGGGAGGGGQRKNTAKDELGLPELQPLDVQVSASDVLEHAGQVLSVLEGVVVVQAPENSAALAEGSVLALDDIRVAVGRVEEVFGPVMQPFYVLRWAGQGDAPAELVPGARISYVASMSNKIASDTLRGRERPVDYDPEVEGPDGEVYFSDDEEEAAFRWKQQAKRKVDGADGPAHAAGGAQAGGRGGKQRRRGDGRPGGPSAALQAHATAGQLGSMLGLHDGGSRGGRGGRGGRGRGGRGDGGRGSDHHQQPQQRQYQKQQHGGPVSPAQGQARPPAAQGPQGHPPYGGPPAGHPYQQAPPYPPQQAQQAYPGPYPMQHAPPPGTHYPQIATAPPPPQHHAPPPMYGAPGPQGGAYQLGAPPVMSGYGAPPTGYGQPPPGAYPYQQHPAQTGQQWQQQQQGYYRR